MNTALTTELDAVNTMLSTIGEAPVNSLNEANTHDVSFAVQRLSEVNRDCQSEGWNFNTDLDITLARNNDNEVVFPLNMLWCVLEQCTDIKPVIRGPKAYDQMNATYEFDQDLIAEKIVYLRPFTELPEAARRYITIRAARVFAERIRGDQASHFYTAQEETRALRQLRKQCGQIDRLNMGNAPGVSEILSRRPTWR